jgi:hypothetical protein
MSDRVKLARQMAAMSESRFIEIKPEPRTRLRRTNDWLFVEIPRERGGGRVPYTEEQLEAIRGGLTAEQWRLNLIRWSSATEPAPNSEPAPDSQANPASEPHDADAPAENPDADK